nr:MAG TPA: hypothetical protein [Caudoviricetes sp.]
MWCSELNFLLGRWEFGSFFVIMFCSYYNTWHITVVAFL